MIPNQWYIVLESSQVQPGKPVGVTRMGEKLVFWRDDDGRVHCLRDHCPHRGAALSPGRVLAGRIECPFHGFQFDSGGQCCLVPANGRQAPFPRQLQVEGYPTHEAYGWIYLWWGQPLEEMPAPRYFSDLDGMAHASRRVSWNTHYSRAIENQLDVAHLPFVHATTIGRGGRTVTDGPYLRWLDPDWLRVVALNRADDGRPPLRPEEVEWPGGSFWLDFIFPNLWQNHLGDASRIVVAFVPVDNEHTMMYLRFYQGLIKLPGLGRLFCELAMPLNLRILRQDQGVVETQQPKPSALKGGEKLIQADRPIVAYRKRREELIECARLA
jgi:phenylpropionate dioxygenase-like ring-hydroxylating dioxygenase large terminal subunit